MKTFFLIAIVFFSGCQSRNSAELSEYDKPQIVNDYSDAKTGEPVLIYMVNETSTEAGPDPEILDWVKSFVPNLRVKDYPKVNPISVKYRDVLERAAQRSDVAANDREMFEALGKRIQSDWTTFSMATWSILHQFWQPDGPKMDATTLLQRSGPNTVLFSNSLIHSGVAMVYRRSAARSTFEDAREIKETLRKKYQENIPAPLQAHPIADQASVSKAFDLVAEWFPPNKYRYILIVKSHGMLGYAIVPFFGKDITGIPVDQLIDLQREYFAKKRAIKAAERAKGVGQDKDGSGQDKDGSGQDKDGSGQDKDGGAGQDKASGSEGPGMAKDQDVLSAAEFVNSLTFEDISESVQSEASLGLTTNTSRIFGVTKSEFLKTIADHKMYFSTLILEACNSSFADKTDPGLAEFTSNGSIKKDALPNLGTVYATRNSIGYQTLSIPAMMTMSDRWYHGNFEAAVTDYMRTLIEKGESAAKKRAYQGIGEPPKDF